MTWIEQLASKRDSVGADVAVAVSSSGFSEGAVRKAKDLRIQLRRVEDVDSTDVFSWLGTTGLELRTDRFEIESVDMIASRDASQELVTAVLSDMPQPFRTDSEVFRIKATGKPATVVDIWNDIRASEPRIRNTYEILHPGRENGLPLGPVIVEFPNPEQRYQVVGGAGVVDVEMVKLVGVTLWVESEMVPFSRLREYTDGEGLLVQAAEVDFAGPKGQVTLTLGRSPEGTFGRIEVAPE